MVSPSAMPERERADTNQRLRGCKMDGREPRIMSKYAGRLGFWREPPPLRVLQCLDFYPWLVVGTVCIGAFMGQVDASIAQLVLPELRREFHEPVHLVAWVAIVYLLVVTVMLPIVGRLADILGRKLLYCGGFLVFVVGSGLSGLAPGLDALIGARVLQALGASLMMANSVAIIVATVGPARRGRGLGVQAAAQAVGLSTGPALGGFLISALGWRWVFWINVPVGLIGAAIGLLVLPRTEQTWNPGRFDLLGAILLVPALGLLLLALNQAGRSPLASPLLLGPIAAGVALLIGFVYRQRHTESPLISPELFHNAQFVAGNIAAFLSFALLFGAFFVMPFVLERVYGDSPLMAGLRLTAIPVALGLVAPISGALYDRVGAKLLKVAGALTLLASSLLLVYVLDSGASRLLLLTGLLALLGAGQGLFTASNNSEVMGTAAAGETGQVGGLLQMFRTFGMSFGISLASVILSLQVGEATRRSLMMDLPAADVARGAAMSFIAFAALALVAAGLSLVRGDRHKRAAG
jgi:EmrB/QacA subfamily drug resistance transporter